MYPPEIQASMVQYPSQDGTQINAYLSRPAAAGRYPGVVVIMEAFGLNDHIKDVARRFAEQGYIAVAPDMYTREGAPDPSNIDSVIQTMLSVPDTQAVADLDGAIRHIKRMPDSNGKVGAIGFCSGGRQTLLFACSSNKVDAAVDCWGGFIHRATPDAETTPARPTPILNLVDRLSCPLFAVFGEEDQNPTVAQSEELRTRAQRAGKDVTIKVYKNAGHAFLADYRPSYREQPALELWSDAVAFFDKQLKG